MRQGNLPTIRDVVDSRHLSVEFDFNDVLAGSPISLGEIIPGSYVSEVVIEFSEAFDGGVQFTIGDTTAQARLMTVEQNEPGYTFSFKNDPDFQYTDDTEIFLFIVSGTPTQGSGKVIVYLN